jgi:outer membrane protein assembly factor BamB/tRNA A-37 threonylcarbamoyl transferase component Bud32
MADKESSEHPRKDADLETRSIRGLSHRLRQPLSLDSNLPPENHDPERAHAQEDEDRDAQQDENEPSDEVSVGTRNMSVPQSESEESLQAQKKDLRMQTRKVAAQNPSGASQKSSQAPPGGLLAEGTELQKRYRILGVIGVGGMGAVYKAQDLRFSNVRRVCAVKEMINTASDPKVREMIIRNFEREASILATLSHPAIPQVYDYFTEGNRSYLVLEYISGKDLEALLGEAEGFFQESQLIEWAVQLCDVLSFLHNHEPRPIIFRDLKPSNIMLDNHNRVRLVDFGIAKLFQSGVKGTMIGTEGYSPPEQYRGTAEPRGDIYALGATLHHLLSKQDPRLEPPFSFHERPIHETNPTVSRELVTVLEKALAYDINDRWGSAEELKRALLRVPTAQGIASSGRGDKTATFGSGGVKALWRFACEDEIRASVAVADGHVFVPSYDHNVYALDAESGEFVWKYPTEGGVGTTPLVEEDMVLFGSTDTNFYAVERASGRLIWSTSLKRKIYSSPFVDLGHVFVGCDDGNLYAIHLVTGRQVWSYEAEGPVRSRPLLADNNIYFSSEAGVVYAMGLDRKVRWRFRARRGILSSPVLNEGLILVGSMDWNFYGLDARSGWAAWRYRTGGPIVSTPAVSEDLVFFGSTDGCVYALNASDGRVVWRYEIEEQVTASPAVYHSNVYVGGVDGNIYCLDAQSGNLNWTYQTDAPITARPVVVDDVLYLGSLDHYIYAIPA